MVKAQLAVEQEPLGGVAPGVVDEFGEGGVFGGESSLQRLGMNPDVQRDVGEGDSTGGQELADEAADQLAGRGDVVGEGVGEVVDGRLVGEAVLGQGLLQVDRA